MLKTKWSENVILVDGDYVDKVTFDLIVNFERMLMRRIPNADLAHWLECIALDGGIRPLGEKKKEERQVQVIFVHKNDRLQYFNPSSYTDDMDGMATAGSGDVLTGLLLSLMAQGYNPIETALLGVFIHGLAGDIYCENQSPHSLIASDLTSNFGKAFKLLENTIF